MRHVTHQVLISESLLKASKSKSPQVNAHSCRWTYTSNPISGMVRAAGQYADNYRARYQSDLSDDKIMGDAWIDMLRNIRVFLTGDIGGLDAGTVDALISDMAALEGFNLSE